MLLKKSTPSLDVLIVDDEIDICFLLGNVLNKRLNANISCANTITSATSEMILHQPSIVFLDNHLPDGSGMSFLKHLKEFYPDTKVVMITAYDTSNDRNMAMEIGADAFIAKPFTKALINKTVDALTN